MRILKWHIKLTDEATELVLPVGAECVLVGEQHGQPTLWFECPNTNEAEKRLFLVRGTGHEYTTLEAHVGSFFSGPFVWHVFEVR